VPENADVFLLQAAEAARSGDKDAAISFARRAYNIQPHTGTVLALGNYQQRMGEQQAATDTYRQWLQEHPGDVRVLMQQANNSMTAGQDAVEQYRHVLTLESDNVVALNNLAWLLRERAPEESLDYARRASQLQPDNAAVLDTLAVVEYLNGNLEVASRSIQRALEATPGQPSMLYHSAMIDAARGETESAKETLGKLLEGTEDFPERAEARSLYEELREQRELP